MPKLSDFKPEEVKNLSNPPLKLSDFHPDEITKVNQEEMTPGRLEALARGGAQGLTAGFSDEITGAGEAVSELPEILFGSKTLGDTYRKGRDEARAANKAAQEAHPGFYFGGELAGGLAPGLLTAGATAPAQAASIAGTIGRAGLAGAAMGGIAGAGTSEADLTKGELGQSALDVGKGAAIGGITGLAGEGAIQGVKGLGKAILPKTSVKAAEMGRAGENLFKEEVRDNVLNEKFRYAEKLSSTLNELRSKKGKNLDAALDEMPNQINIEEANNKIREFIKTLNPNKEEELADINKLTKFLDKSTSLHDVPLDTLNPEQIQTLKQGFSDYSNFGRSGLSTPKGEKVAGDSAKTLNKLLANSSDNYATANQEYGALANTLDTLGINSKPSNEELMTLANKLGRLQGKGQESANAKEVLNQSLKNLDSVDPNLSAQIRKDANEMALRNETARKAGSSIAIEGPSLKGLLGEASTKGANAVGLTSHYLTGIPKEKLGMIGQYLTTKTDDQIAQRIGNILINASQKDDTGRNAIIYTLMQNPDYRKFLGSKFGIENKE